MMRSVAVLAGVILCFVSLTAAQLPFCNGTSSPTGTPNYRLSSVPVDPQIVASAQYLFPEQQKPHPSITATDVSFQLLERSDVSITFVWEGAGYRNRFGYFIYDGTSVSADERIQIFPDVTDSCLPRGTTVTVGTFAPNTIIAFWVQADGFNNAGMPYWYSINNTIVRNQDNYRHTSWVKTGGVILIGFEDLDNLGDADYNDVMFYVNINGSYVAEIPEYTNGTLEVCEDSEIISYTEYNCTQYALLTARNSLACQGYIRLTPGWEIAPDNAVVKAALQQNAASIGSNCVVLASGTGYNPTDLSVCATNALKPFNGEELCFATPCTNRILIRGQSLPVCTGSESLPCNPGVDANIISQFPTFPAPLPIYPTDYNIYLNTEGGVDATITLPFVVSVPEKPKVDFMILIDLAGLTANDYGTIRSETSRILDLLTARGYLGLAGFATLSRDGAMNIRSSLTSSSSSLLGAVDTVTIPSPNTATGPSNILGSVSSMYTATNVGWRSNAFKVVVVVTNNDYSSAISVSTFNQSTRNAGIVPVFLPTSAVESSYNSLASSLSMAYTLRIPGDYSYITKGRDAVDAFVRTIQVNPKSDVNGFITNLPAIDTAVVIPGPSQSIKNITFAYPAGLSSSVQFPLTVDLTFWGYTGAKVNIYVNNAPVVLSSLPFVTSYNSTLAYKILADDADRNALTMMYTSVSPPSALDYFKNSLGQSITLDTPTTDFGGVFTPATDFFKGTVNVTVTVFDGCATSPGQLIVFKVLEDPNEPPDSEDMKIITMEDTPVSFKLPARDFDPEDAIVLNELQAIVIFMDDSDDRGHFYTDETKTVRITAGSLINGPRNVYFEPAPNAVSNPTTIPIASFKFQVIDTKGATSPVRTVVVIVLPVNDPPVYGGSTILTIDEDTQAHITLLDLVSDIDSPIDSLTVSVTQTVGKGTLTECAENGEGGCANTDITSANVPFIIDRASNEQGRVIFTPAANEFGNNYANFVISVFDGEDTSVYTITINVLPVNDPPVVVPTFSVSPIPNEMDEDTELILTWTVTDIDSPVESLKTLITTQIPAVSKMYMCVANGEGCDKGSVITLPGEIPAFAPGSFKVVFVPDPNIYDAKSFARMTFIGVDDFQARSVPVNAVIRVLPINDPPIISASEFTVTRTEGLKVPMGALVISDIDVKRSQSIVITLTVQDNTGTFGFEGADAAAIIEPVPIERGEDPSPPCTLTDDAHAIECRDTMEQFNDRWFKSMVFYPSTNNRHIITVFADDLGHTDKWDRPLNDTKLVIVNVGEDTGLTEETGEDNTLTIAVAVSVAGAVGAVALVIFLVKDKLAGKTDAFFDSLTEPLTTGAVNPVYQTNAIAGENPVYQPNTN